MCNLTNIFYFQSSLLYRPTNKRKYSYTITLSLKRNLCVKQLLCLFFPPNYLYLNVMFLKTPDRKKKIFNQHNSEIYQISLFN